MVGVLSDRGFSDDKGLGFMVPRGLKTCFGHHARRFRLKTFALMTLQLMLVFGIMEQWQQTSAESRTPIWVGKM